MSILLIEIYVKISLNHVNILGMMIEQTMKNDKKSPLYQYKKWILEKFEEYQQQLQSERSIQLEEAGNLWTNRRKVIDVKIHKKFQFNKVRINLEPVGNCIPEAVLVGESNLTLRKIREDITSVFNFSYNI